MPFPDPLDYLNIGNSHYEMESYEEAIRSYEKIPSIDAVYINGMFRMGEAYSALKNYEKAMDCFEIVLDLDPKDAEAAQNLNKLKELVRNPKKKRRAIRTR
jgi:superkiller protein 3